MILLLARRIEAVLKRAGGLTTNPVAANEGRATFDIDIGNTCYRVRIEALHGVRERPRELHAPRPLHAAPEVNGPGDC